jgi:hypothetical protein
VYFGTVFPDGSALWIKSTGGQATVKGDVTEFTDVALTIVGGKGKFAEIRGDGLLTGIRASPLPNSGAELALDFTLNLKSGDQADAAKAMLEKAVAAVKADRDVAFAEFNRGDFNRAGITPSQDLYPFCTRLTDGKIIATATLGTRVGTDTRTLRDPNGVETGKLVFDAMSRPVGVISEVHYLWPKPGTTAPLLPKTSLVTRVSSDLGCGVGYYK